MGKIKKILENELVGGTQSTDVYPVTSVKAVYDENNERLDHILNRRGTVNISTNYNDDHIAEVLTLAQAIAKVPSKDRVLGFQGKFLTENGWVTYQFNGDSISNWNDQDYWSPILDSNNLLSGLGGDAKHTISQIGISRAILQSQGLDGSRYTGSAFYAYSEAIKFIAFLPKEGEEDHEFSIYALSTHSGSSLEAPSTSSINLWILDDTLSKATGSEVGAAKYIIVGGDNILDKIQFIKQSGNHGTLYAIVDWNPIYNYKNSNGLYTPVIWGTDFSNPTTVKVQKVSKDDPRIVNWNNLAVRAEDLVNEFGVDTTKILDQKTISSLFGVGNGLSFYYNERASLELKAMRIIKKLYFSSFESEPKEMGIGVLGSNAGSGTEFWFGICYLDGTSATQKWITTDLIPVDSLPNGVESFYVEKAGFGKMYVEIDFAAYKELGSTIWSWNTPICKVTNVLSADDEIWNSLTPTTLISSLTNSELRLNSVSPELSIQAGSGYIDYNNGNIVTGLWNYFVYECNPSDTVEIRIDVYGGAIGTNVCSVYAIYNSVDDISSNTLVSKGPQWNAKATTFYQRISIPSTAKCIVFCAQRVKNLTVIRRSTSTLRDYTSTLKNSKYVLNNLNGRFINEDLKQAVVDARLILDDESKHLEFWSGSHSFKKNEESYTSPQRLWGCCQAVGGYMNWYWMYPNGGYIPYNSSFSLARGEGKTIKDGIEYFVKSVTLDNYSAKLHIVINWMYVPNESNVFSGNYLDNSIISTPHDGIIQNLLFIPEPETISPTQFSDMTKLNFGVDGDSITAGNQWSYYVTQYLGFATHHNVGVGSATWACKKQTLNNVTYQTQEYDDPDFAGISSGWQSTTDPVEIQKRCNNCAKVHIQKFIAEVKEGTYPKPDIFAFAMGTNDSNKTSADAAISTGTDYPSGDMLFTLPGAMKWCIQKIHETYPDCKIFILLPIQRYTGGNENNLQKIEIMKDIAKAFSVEVIDMYSNCGISSMLETGTGPYLSDGLHPNTAGQKLMGKYAASQIRNYIY